MEIVQWHDMFSFNSKYDKIDNTSICITLIFARAQDMLVFMPRGNNAIAFGIIATRRRAIQYLVPEFNLDKTRWLDISHKI